VPLADFVKNHRRSALQMATVYFQPQLRDLTGGESSADVPGATLRQIVVALDVLFPGMAERLVAHEALAPGIAASIDGVVTARGLLAAVSPASEIHFLPAIGGG
jgi:molybdopterin synthase sulfur carrier subunit